MDKKMRKSGFAQVCKTIWAVAFIVLITGLLKPDQAFAQERVHSVFFEGTDSELHVYRIHGQEAGKTLILIGGIQGDEPGGFLSADLYADFSLAKGTLIVVPRANFQSIVLRRRKVNEDMNRKFAEDLKSNYETRIVAILKELISESDGLLNLHDGSGFYSDKWEGPYRNPKRFGQSIIADCEDYVNPDTEQSIHLGKMARCVAERINMHIENPLHHFHFNNHRTQQKASSHKEQRKSATYYALYTCGIPAFGIETSKSLPLEMKLRYHKLVINAFMELFNIIPETPGIYLDKPVLNSIAISVNNCLPVVIKNRQTLHVNSGDFITISHIQANYERGLSADIVGYGTINDMRKKIRITKPTRIVVKKDCYTCGTIYVSTAGSRKNMAVSASGPDPILNPPLFFFRIRINGEERIFQSNEHVKIIKGDRFEIVDVISGIADSSDPVVNFKGYVGDKQNNTGEDRGYIIDTGRDLWKRYSLNKKGKAYQLVVTNRGNAVAKLFVDLEAPVLKYIVLKTKDDNMQCFEPGDMASVSIRGPLKLIDINTNVDRNLGVKAFIMGPGSFVRGINIKDDIAMDNLKRNNPQKSFRCRIEIRRDNIVLGSIYLDFLQEMHCGK